MHVDAASRRYVQYVLRQYQPVSRNDDNVRFERRQFGDRPLVAQGDRLHDRDAACFGIRFYRARHDALAAAGGPVRLGQDSDRRDAGVNERGQRGARELGRAGEYHPGIFHRGGVGAARVKIAYATTAAD